MENTNTQVSSVVQIAVRALPLCFKDELNTFAEEAGVALESLQYRLAEVGRAEMGKLTFKDGKPGIANISKGCASISVGNRKVATPGQNYHPAIGFWREMQAASAYSSEFTTAVLALSKPSAEFVEETCERIAEQEATKASSKSAVKSAPVNV